MVTSTRNPQKALQAISKYFEMTFKTGSNKQENKTLLQAQGYIFSEDIIHHTISGTSSTLDFVSDQMNRIAVTEKMKTHEHGRDYHHKVSKIGLEIGMQYSFMNTILRKLFDTHFTYSRKILALSPREVYSFVLNNEERLKRAIREAMAADLKQMVFTAPAVSSFPFHLPQTCLFTYDRDAKSQNIMYKNVYHNYLSSAAPRSLPERRFERFCEQSDRIEWWYKNGDKGNEYLSIVYQDNAGKQKLFYPDYLIGVAGEIWVIETKGGFDSSGNSQDIDLFTARKFEVLKKYLDRYGLKGGIVCNDEKSDELCICMEHYSEDIQSKEWVILSDLL